MGSDRVMTQVLNARFIFRFLSVAAALLAWLASGGSFLDDDWGHVRLAAEGIGSILSTGWEGLVGQGGYYRPVVVLSFYLDYLVAGFFPGVYHLTNVLIHLCCALMAVRLGRRLDLPERAAWGAGLLFFVLPLHTDTVFWIVGRTDSLCTLFYLGALSLFLSYVDRPNLRTFAGFCACGALSFFSKEMALSLPISLVVLTAFHGNIRKRSAHRALAGMMGILIAYFVVRFVVLGGLLTGTPGHFDPMPWAVDLARAVAKFGMTDLKWFGAAVLGVTAIVFFAGPHGKSEKGRRLLQLVVLTCASLIPTLGHLHNWYLYLPSAFFCLGVSWVWLLSDRRIFQFCFAALVLYYGVVMVREGFFWRDASALSEWVIAETLPHAHATSGRLFVMNTPSAWIPSGSVSGKPLFAFALKNALEMRARKPFLAEVVMANHVWLTGAPFRSDWKENDGWIDLEIERGGFFSFHGPGEGRAFPFEVAREWGAVRAVSADRLSVRFDVRPGDRVVVFDGDAVRQIVP